MKNKTPTFDRKEFVDMLTEYYPDYNPFLTLADKKYKPYTKVRGEVYKILKDTNYRGNLTDYNAVQNHWEEILKQRETTKDYLRRYKISMIPNVRLNQLPKGLSKQERLKYELKYNEEYIEFLNKKEKNRTKKLNENEFAQHSSFSLRLIFSPSNKYFRPISKSHIFFSFY